jgi:hypothetical protein
MTRNSHDCCAERLLLRDLSREAVRHGMRRDGAATYAWIRRKFGHYVIVERPVSAAPTGFGCSLPCVDCRRALSEVGLKVRAFVGDAWVTYESASAMPPSKLSAAALSKKR